MRRIRSHLAVSHDSSISAPFTHSSLPLCHDEAEIIDLNLIWLQHLALSITAPLVRVCRAVSMCHLRNIVVTQLGSNSSVVLTHQTQKRAVKHFHCSSTFIVPYEANKMAFHSQVVLIKILQLLTNTVNLSH